MKFSENFSETRNKFSGVDKKGFKPYNPSMLSEGQRSVLVGSCGAILIALVFLFAGVFTQPSSYSEIATIARGVGSFKELSDKFSGLAAQSGALYAYEVLRRAELPPGTDLHLLAHVIGDELYKEKGISGIADCTQEFRNACSHSIVIGALNEFGAEAASIIEKLQDACQKAPGGSGAYTMCFHGLGHGVFSYFGYSFPETIQFCKRVGTKDYRDREYVECMGGAMMELMGGGGHDKKAWVKARLRYVSGEDPLAPCSTAVIPEDVKPICYTYLTPHLFEAAGADLAAPEPRHFAVAFQYCGRVPYNENASRAACYGGLGKEFIVLALKRDIRSVAKAGEAELRTMKAWCGLAEDEDGKISCEDSVVDSLYWGGENGPGVAVRFCSLFLDSESFGCFNYLFGAARFYLPPGHPERETLCSAVPERWRPSCAEKLL
ncbi:MAG: hypothetical protein AAB597_01705 [Patescibacteria group bacterium]